MYAVIRTGGKQYKVAPQDVLKIEKVEGAAGDAVHFEDVLMVGGDGDPHFGAPLVSGAVVSAEVVEQGRGPKIIIFKKKRRQNYRRKRGHRQELTTVKILEIVTAGGEPARAAKQAETAPQTGEKKAKSAPRKAADDSAQSEAETPKKPRAKKEE